MKDEEHIAGVIIVIATIAMATIPGALVALLPWFAPH